MIKSIGYAFFISALLSSEAFSSIPPESAVRNISIQCEGQDATNTVTIYGNGNMQARCRVDYVLNDGWTIHQTTILEDITKIAVDELEAWASSDYSNGFPHIIGHSTQLGRYPVANSEARSYEYHYISANDGHLGAIDTCVLVEAKNSHGDIVARDNCDGYSSGVASIKTILPKRISKDHLNWKLYGPYNQNIKNATEYQIMDLELVGYEFDHLELVADIPGKLSINRYSPHRNISQQLLNNYFPDSSNISQESLYLLERNTTALTMVGFQKEMNRLQTELVAPVASDRTLLRTLFVRHFAQWDSSKRTVYDSNAWGHHVVCYELDKVKHNGVFVHSCLVNGYENPYYYDINILAEPVEKRSIEFTITDLYGTVSTLLLDSHLQISPPLIR